MEIIWIGGEREVPGIGRLNDGDVRDVPEDIGRSLIDQGMARKQKPVKKTEKKSSPPREA